MRVINRNSTLLLLRISVAALFAYFGFFALAEPSAQAGAWISQWALRVIQYFIEPVSFMVILGAVQIVIAAMLASGVFFRLASVIGAILIAGIIINLGFGELALRDFVVFAALSLLAVMGPGAYRI